MLIRLVSGGSSGPFECSEEVSVFIHSLLFSSGSESVGSTDMCKTDEAKGSHRQRQVIAAESRWHSGKLR